MRSTGPYFFLPQEKTYSIIVVFKKNCREEFFCYDYEMNDYTLEEWKPIELYPKYSVSSHGRIKNNKTRQILHLYKTKGGHLMTSIRGENTNNGRKAKTFTVHTLVAEAFIGKCKICNYCGSKLEINHIDENTANNHYKNLEYVTHQSNIKHSKSKTKLKSKEWRKKVDSVHQIVKTEEVVKAKNNSNIEFFG